MLVGRSNHRRVRGAAERPLEIRQVRERSDVPEFGDGVGISLDHQELGLGTGFPPFRGGLLRYADTLGIVEVVQRLDRLASVHGPRFRPVPLLRDLARSGRTFLPT